MVWRMHRHMCCQYNKHPCSSFVSGAENLKPRLLGIRIAQISCEVDALSIVK